MAWKPPSQEKKALIELLKRQDDFRTFDLEWLRVDPNAEVFLTEELDNASLHTLIGKVIPIDDVGFLPLSYKLGERYFFYIESSLPDFIEIQITEGKSFEQSGFWHTISFRPSLIGIYNYETIKGMRIKGVSYIQTYTKDGIKYYFQVRIQDKIDQTILKPNVADYGRSYEIDEHSLED